MGRSVVVTGGGTGIGRAIAVEFLAEGASVVLAGRDEARLKAVARELDPAGGRTAAVGCNVTQAAAVEHLMDAAIERFGGIDVLVNNAGTVTLAECADMSEEEWDLVIDVNVKGVFLCSRAAIPKLRARGGGVVLNVASQAGKRGYPKLTHYCASKSAVIGFTWALAAELAPAIRVNAICPGIVNTEMMDREYGWEEDMTGVPREQIQQRWLAGIPMGRFQEPEHVARAALFLASEDASEVTGEAFNVTGGAVAD